MDRTMVAAFAGWFLAVFLQPWVFEWSKHRRFHWWAKHRGVGSIMCTTCGRWVPPLKGGG